MACTAKQFADTLQGWVGRNEKDGTHKMIIDLYNSHTPRARGYKVTYKDAWCATTMGAAAVKCNATDICPMECSCGEIINLAKKAGIWIENDDTVPEIGDWVVYDWDDDKKTFRVTDNKGYPEHVGGVVSVDFAAETFKVVEGNFSDAVKVRTLEINGLYIRGFVRPRYTAEPVVAPAPAPVAPAPLTGGVIGTAVAKTSMKVRNLATTSDSKVVGYISTGQTVEVLEVLSNGWFKIAWKDGFAYTSNAGNKYYTYTAKAVATPAPAPAPTTNPTRKGVKYKMNTLRKGSTGNQVTIFETIMKELGYYKGAIDTEFGSGCVAACNAFQNDYPECGTNGEPDNTWGPNCWNKLFSLVGA